MKLLMRCILVIVLVHPFLLNAEDYGQILFEPDANNNNIQDDLEKIIMEKYPSDPMMMKFYLEYVRQFQSFVQSYNDNDNDKDKSLYLTKKMDLMNACLYRIRPDQARSVNIVADIRPKLLVTEELSRAYFKALRNRKGAPGQINPEEVSSNDCAKYF